MTDSSPALLALPQWEGESRKIRLIYLVNSSSFTLAKCPGQGPVIPLYLGADILFNTDVRTENHPRYHAKFAKRGLATKVTFSAAFRFQGLKVPAANNSLWFYSIQGLFRVAFEMYSKQEQLAVLENFQDVWKSQINDSPLKMNYSLSAQMDLSASPRAFDIKSRREMSPPPPCQAGGELMDGCSSDTADSSADRLASPSTRLHPEPTHPIVSTLREKLRSLDSQLATQPRSRTERLETALLLLESVHRYVNGNLEEKDVAITVLALLKAEDWTRDSVYSCHLLTCVGRWLGQQFHAANSTISQKVEAFKVRHIERISDLPPAEELTTELFPEAMQTLLLHWMGLCGESTLEKRHSEFPILLLILEFANHNLITGVAHVLYSSLIC
ncbi:unnamed protein product, partial [Menidia menidia]